MLPYWFSYVVFGHEKRKNRGVDITVVDADDMRAFGQILGHFAHAGDVIMLNGPLGAGKTTMTQGIAQAMNVRGRVQSPTFVIAQVHHSQGEGPTLVHVDAYRLTSLEELDALDLDTSLDESVTVVEWGEGKVEVLTADRLMIAIIRPEGTSEGESVETMNVNTPRTLRLQATGPRSRELAAHINATLAREPERWGLDESVVR